MSPEMPPVEVVKQYLHHDGWEYIHVLSHLPLTETNVMGLVPADKRQHAGIRTWADEARMYHAEVRWPYCGVARWRAWSLSDGGLWELLVGLWWMPDQGRISAAALAAADEYQRYTDNPAIVGWVHKMPKGMPFGEVTLPGGEILTIGEVYWVPKGFIAVTGKEEKWRRLGNAQMGTR